MVSGATGNETQDNYIEARQKTNSSDESHQLGPKPCLPEPILINPLCWINIVSQDKLPCTMGVSHPWR